MQHQTYITDSNFLIKTSNFKQSIKTEHFTAFHCYISPLMQRRDWELIKNQTTAKVSDDSVVTHVFLVILVILFAGNSSLGSLNLNS